jgi:hypothetical protein
MFIDKIPEFTSTALETKFCYQMSGLFSFKVWVRVSYAVRVWEVKYHLLDHDHQLQGNTLVTMR